MRVESPGEPDGSRRGAGGDEEKKKVSRRDFITTIGVGAGVGSIVMALVGAMRATIPAVLPDPSEQFKIGLPGDFSDGTVRNFGGENVIVFRDSEGIYAISTVCTHLGCIVTYSEEGFHCPCHGSKFSPRGEITRGPAPKALEWLEISALPGGTLVVNRAQPVRTGTKLKLEGLEA